MLSTCSKINVVSVYSHLCLFSFLYLRLFGDVHERLAVPDLSSYASHGTREGVGDQGSLQNERRLQLRGSSLGDTHETDTLGGTSSTQGHLPPRRHSWRTPCNSRGCPRRYREDVARKLGPGARGTPDVPSSHGRRDSSTDGEIAVDFVSCGSLRASLSGKWLRA